MVSLLASLAYANPLPEPAWGRPQDPTTTTTTTSSIVQTASGQPEATLGETSGNGWAGRPATCNGVSRPAELPGQDPQTSSGPRVFFENRSNKGYKIKFVKNGDISWTPKSFVVPAGQTVPSSYLEKWAGRFYAVPADGSGQQVENNVGEVAFTTNSFFDMSVICPIMALNSGIVFLNVRTGSSTGGSGCLAGLINCDNQYLKTTDMIGTQASHGAPVDLLAVII